MENLEVFNSCNSSRSPPLCPRLIPLQLLYGKLNKLLRDEDRAKLKPFFPYLKVLLTALERLPNIVQMVGVGCDGVVEVRVEGQLCFSLLHLSRAPLSRRHSATTSETSLS